MPGKSHRCNLEALSFLLVAYDVQTQVFEGPFDVLLHLILREEVDLYEISMVRIVDEFVAYVDRLDEPDLELTTEFLLIAATLVQLKARRLLPDDESLTLDEELAVWSERDLLLARLVECKTFKDAASALARMVDDARRCALRLVGPEDQFLDLAPDPMAGVTPEKLRDALVRALAPRPEPRIDLDHVAPVRASVAETVVTIADRLRRVGRVTFRDLTASLATRLEVVVHFLAILELYKEDRIELDQVEIFGEIRITWRSERGSDPLSWHAGFEAGSFEAGSFEAGHFHAGSMLVDSYDG